MNDLAIEFHASDRLTILNNVSPRYVLSKTNQNEAIR